MGQPPDGLGLWRNARAEGFTVNVSTCGLDARCSLPARSVGPVRADVAPGDARTDSVARGAPSALGSEVGARLPRERREHHANRRG